MVGFLVHVGSTIICPHSGQVYSIATNRRVFVDRNLAVTQSDLFTITGCPFTLGGTPHPCILTKWLVPASRVFINHKPVILQNSSGLCQSADQTPQGTPTVITTQTRVRGT